LATFKVTAAWVGKFSGITYTVTDLGVTYTYDVNKGYTNFPWGNFQVTYVN
jgi:hypothetical protein